MRKSLTIAFISAVALGTLAGTSGEFFTLKDTATPQRGLTVGHAKVQTEGQKRQKRPRLRTHQMKGIYPAASSFKATSSKIPVKKAPQKRILSSTVNLMGTMVYAESWTGSQYGLYNIPPSGTGFEKFASFHQNYNYGAVNDGEGRFYGVNYTDFMGYWDYVSFDVYDTETWTLLSSGEAHYDVMSQGAAVDPTTGDIYGVFHSADGESWNWAKADYPNATNIPIAPCNDVYFMSVGADAAGQFYGVGTDQMFYKIDKLTGQLTAVAKVDVPWEDYFQGGCVNIKNNTYIQSYCTPTESGLVEIDLATGESTLLNKFPDHNEFVGLYIGQSVAEDNAPGIPELSVVCQNGAMDVEISLSLPSVHFDESSAAGETFDYVVLADGEAVVSGKAEAGAVIKETVSFDSPGVVSFVATVSNEAGTSPKAKASCFVGKGAPAAPTDVKLSWADGKATLTWTGVTEATDGGYLNPDDVTYTVYSQDGTELTTTSSTVFTADVPASTGGLLNYSVCANYGGKNSEKVASNTVLVGELSAPFSMDLTEEANFSIHSVVDANSDGKTWWYNLGACYSYDALNTGDDWLFSPGIRMEAGKAYRIAARVKSHHANYVERIEIRVGQGSDPSAMSFELIPATDITSSEPVELGDYFIPEVSGLYNIGFHAISEPNQWSLYVPSYEVSAPINGGLPSMVTDAEVTPDPEGYLKATVTFTAPTLTVLGHELKGDVTVKVARNGEPAGELKLPAGEKGSIIDSEIPEAGKYTYTITSYDTEGNEGQAVSITAVVGPKAPQDIDQNSVSMIETEPGTYLLSWAPVTKTVEGMDIRPENVSYRIYTTVESYDGLSLGQELGMVTDTQFTYTPDPIDTQQLLYLCVRPFNLTAGGDTFSVGMAIAGPAYELPICYSNADSLKEYFLLYGGDGKLKMFDSRSVPGITPQDDDDAYMVIENGALGQVTYFTTGKIKIAGESPALSFYAFCLTGVGETKDLNTSTVSVICDGEEHIVGTVNNSELEPAKWNKIRIALDKFAGKTVQIKISATCHGYAYNLYDRLKVYNELAHDVSAKISSPEKVETGESFDIAVTVVNEGSEASKNVSVSLLRDGECVGIRDLGHDLKADAEEMVRFSQTLDLYSPETVEFKAVVTAAEDEDKDNDATPVITVSRRISALPRVEGLRGEAVEDGHSLTWDAIDTGERNPEEVMEDFEKAESYSSEFEGWTFVDVDKSPVGGFTGIDFPNIVTGVTLGSFFIFDDTVSTMFEAHSGHKFLASLVRYDDGQSDDWAISPTLPGDAQTISFYARSFSANFLESIEVWYSSTDTRISSFSRIEEFGTRDVPYDWTLFTADLPEGARYFAIRSCSTGAFVLLIDDVSFTRLDGFDGELKGYNLYCDKSRVNAQPITANSYLHKAESGVHTYHVTALYDKGESELSEPLTLEQSVVKSVYLTGAQVSVQKHCICITGAEGKAVQVSALDGSVLHTGVGPAKVSVAPGVYVVTIEDRSVKVIVK